MQTKTITSTIVAGDSTKASLWSRLSTGGDRRQQEGERREVRVFHTDAIARSRAARKRNAPAASGQALMNATGGLDRSISHYIDNGRLRDVGTAAWQRLMSAGRGGNTSTPELKRTSISLLLTDACTKSVTERSNQQTALPVQSRSIATTSSVNKTSVISAHVMAPALLLLAALSTLCGAADLSVIPPAVSMRGPPGLPDVSGGRTTIISLKDVPGAKEGGVEFPMPKFDGTFKKAPHDRILGGNPSGRLANLEGYRAGAKRAEEVLPNTIVQLTPLNGTPFEQFVLLGYLPEGTRPKGPWSMVGRLFAKPPGELVYLQEWDFGLDDGGVIMFTEQLNTVVKNNRASLMVTKGGGVRQTQVRWVSGTKQIEILAVCKLTSGCAEPDEWRDIASSIPESPSSKAYNYEYR